ncbi:MAG: caspase family protein [Bradyrhizobium sp.]|uniref:caspase family protein n=1 Tax=Bradyrhizobium sp. TaxID=376 RepID=UPI0012126AF1|nr:caspase family protein [Bradyrhizobium sp.]THD63722.1 MAG: caspase family protein [Bradyrhizobium sp.]
MRRPVFRDLLLVFGLWLFPQISASHAAAAENRVALVVGQSAYRAVMALPNAEHDAKRMAELLGSAGFDVTAAPDLSQDDMRRAFSDFAAKVAASGPDTIALVFYAGHGLQIDGENYLVPVDIDPKREGDIPLQAVRLNDLMNTLGALPTRMRIIMLDACRNNPFPALNQTAGRGLAIVDTKAGATGSFISYSTSPGSEAEDGSGDDSPYTTAVLSVAKEPNLSIEEAFKRIRVAVNQATDGRQTPWESSSLTTEFKFFAAGTDQPGAMAPKPATLTRGADDWRRDLQGKEPKAAYDLVIADDSLAGYEAFVALFPQPPYNLRIRSLLERRREMLAWNTAVAINTAASFEAFIANYANSDLAATARTMQERVRNRSLEASALAVNNATPPPTLTSPAVPPPTNVALAPTCPCTTPPTPPFKKKVETPPPTKRVDKSSPKRKPPTDEDVVERGPPGPPPGSVPPGAVIEGIGIGIGLGSGFGGRGGYPSGGYRR